MTSAQGFHFGILRISMMQLLKAHGFDRAKPSTIDTFADLYIKFFSLLLQEVQKLALARMTADDSICLQDITLALQNLGLVKPVDILDVYEANPELPSDIGFRRLKDWCVNSSSAVDARLYNTPIPELLKVKEGSNNKATNKPLSLIPEYINQLNSGKKNEEDDNEETELVDSMINNGDMDDWIRFMITRQKVSVFKKISGKMPKDIESLPAIPGLKNSVLSRNKPVANGEHVPVVLSDELNQESSNNIAALTSKLPMSNMENRLENISLSFERDSDIDIEDTSTYHAPIEVYDPESSHFSQQFDHQYRDFDEFEATTGDGGLNLGQTHNTEYQELEDMQNTFERRESLVYDGDTYEFNNLN
ncbi:Taf3p Ecym_7313 [Eremothecium cymbalariae DBVPG|uniref:Bromodomain associated domain-containing protein n=1 Tax=Eremothecium cymbalariae (strain CBS 270.75 / DBVPG 7215 / KCTC 17166 / NRRL Y-17582) TaxID=931890 RepID=G8JWD3_ERECY|nr:hypothetical protein Ecym_7313 [Eremothecium cymbalariae DBVPG\